MCLLDLANCHSFIGCDGRNRRGLEGDLKERGGGVNKFLAPKRGLIREGLIEDLR